MIRNPFRDIDAKNLRRSSDLLKKQNDYQKIVNKRLNILTFVTIVLFAAIAGRLIDIQIRQKDDYTTKLASYTSKKQTTSTPRGQFIDRKGNVAVKTVSAMNITYFAPENVTRDAQWELAMKFAKQFQVTGDELTFRDLQDAYISLHVDERGYNDQANHLLSADELKLSNSEVYALKLERITQELVDAELDQDTRAAWVVYSAMEVNNQSSHARVILEDVKEEQVAYLIEHKSEYQGFDVDFSSWLREYPYGSTLRDVFGQVTTSKQGLPSELQQYYQALGYEMNSSVGRSGLEQQYETLLSGTPKVSTIKYDEEGNAIFTEVNAGKKGYDIQLTIDMALQEKIDSILESTMKSQASNANRPDMNKLFVSLMDPNTGEIFAMSGKMKTSDGEIINYASGNYLEGYTPGSIVKGATVYMGLNEGVVTPTEVINDSPMLIQGTPSISSFNNLGNVTATSALEKSSNVYMAHIAIRLAGSSYVKGAPLYVEDATKTFDLMHRYYSMFGLGVLTGLDIPNELLGYSGYTKTAGNLLYYSFGQYDNYTPIQILQYVATIANGGQKVKPRLVAGAFGVNSDSLVYTNEPEVLSTVYGNLEYIKTVQDGFRACVTSNRYCGTKMNAIGHEVAAKTGTAEVIIGLENGSTRASTNASLIGYYPASKPEVAFVCSAPTSSNVQASGGELQTNICYEQIMPEVIKAYYGE